MSDAAERIKPKPTHGGARPGSGQKRKAEAVDTGNHNTVNATAAIERLQAIDQVYEALGITGALRTMSPVDVMLLATRYYVSIGNLSVACSCARDAAPYIHNKLAPVKKSAVNAEDAATLSDAEIHAMIRESQEQVEDEPVAELPRKRLETV